MKRHRLPESEHKIRVSIKIVVLDEAIVQRDSQMVSIWTLQQPLAQLVLPNVPYLGNR